MIQHQYGRRAEPNNRKRSDGALKTRRPVLISGFDGRPARLERLHPHGGENTAETSHENGLVDGKLVHLFRKESERPVRLGVPVAVRDANGQVLDDKVQHELDAPYDGEEAGIGQLGEPIPDTRGHDRTEKAKSRAEIHVHGWAPEKALGVAAR